MILITRPKSEAEELQKQLEKKNIHSLIEPLTHHKFIDRKIKFNEKNIYICASQRCVESLVRLKNNYNINLVVIGKKVEKLLRQNSFKNILYVALDSKQLIKWMKKNNNYLSCYIYLSGNIINNEFINDLKKFQISYKRKIIYQTILKKSFHRNTIKNLKQNKISSIVFFSKTSAYVFFKLLKKYKIFFVVKNLSFFVLSSRIAKVCKSHKIKHDVIKISPKPNQSSIISLILDLK